MTNHLLSGTPIGTLFDMGYPPKRVGEICGVSSSGASKWKMGRNTAGKMRQIRAQAYLDGLAQAPDTVPAPTPIPTQKPIPEVVKAAQPNNDFLVTVPAHRVDKFEKVMAMFGFEFVSLDG